jgi:hypothetical protein
MSGWCLPIVIVLRGNDSEGIASTDNLVRRVSGAHLRLLMPEVATGFADRLQVRIVLRLYHSAAVRGRLCLLLIRQAGNGACSRGASWCGAPVNARVTDTAVPALTDRHLAEHRDAAKQGGLSSSEYESLAARHMDEHRKLTERMLQDHHKLADRHLAELGELSARHSHEHAG